MEAQFELDTYSEALLRLHNHICPRQILGLRMGLYAAALLGVPVPQTDKRLIAFVELNGCFADGVAVSTGCTLGHRTMYLMDYGKTAVTMADSETGAAIRIIPHLESRNRALDVCPNAQSHWHAYLKAYQIIPDDQLIQAQTVSLTVDFKKLISRAGIRVCCEQCGEEIINEREVSQYGRVLCRACAGDPYYMVVQMKNEECHDNSALRYITASEVPREKWSRGKGYRLKMGEQKQWAKRNGSTARNSS